MNKILLVIKREYLERVRSKWFLIGTLLGPLLMSSFILVPIVVQRVSSPNRIIAFVDTANDPTLSAAIEDKLHEKNESDRFTIKHRTAADPAALAALQKDLAAEIEE